MDQKDTSKESQSLSSVSDRYAYVAAKNQKLASALYLVTNFLNDSEPIKWKLRERSLELATEFMTGRPTAVFYKLSLLEKGSHLCEEIVGLLDIARTLGSVSEMNLSVLKQEYETLKTQLEELAGGKQLERFLLVSELPKPKVEVPITPTTASPIPVSYAQPKRPASVSSHHTDGLASKNTRKQAILSYLADKNWTSIKDIASAVPDCSQKTVQRELSDLVEQGVLKKRGDRRWSRYVLVK
jgi:hypothetical protein